jgi:hypothetical protein
MPSVLFISKLNGLMWTQVVEYWTKDEFYIMCFYVYYIFISLVQEIWYVI